MKRLREKEVCSVFSAFCFFVFAFVLAFVLLATPVNAAELADNVTVKIDGEVLDAAITNGVFVSDYIEVDVTFVSVVNESDVRVKAWIDGYRDEVEEETERFDVIAGRKYTKELKLKLPSDMDSDEYVLVVRIAGKNKADELEYALTVQRKSYMIEILSVEYVKSVKAGESFGIDVVVKNRGSQKIEDVYIKARLPELGIERRVYAGDLTPYDEENKEDAVEKSVIIQIPEDAKSGTYELVIEAYNDDAKQSIEKELEIEGKEVTSGGVEVITPETMKLIEAGETGEYVITLLNLGNEEETVTIAGGVKGTINITADPAVVTLQPNEAKDVKVKVETTNTTTTGNYTVPLKITGEDSEPIKELGITANVIKSTEKGARPAAILTVVLLVVIVVLAIAFTTTIKKKRAGQEQPETTDTEEAAYF